jgi:hypothetical protein
MESGVPRRQRLDLNTPAELAIFMAIQEVEKAGADPKLTDVVMALISAKDKLSDYVDSSGVEVVERVPTLGETRVRSQFNPGASDVVSIIKAKSAELIDLCEPLKGKDARLASLAQTSFEDAAMWAVKAATA